MSTAESLFRDHFLPHYPEDAKADLARARSVDANPARNPSVYAHLGEAAEIFAGRMGIPGLDFTDASVHRLSTALKRDEWIESGELFNVVVHGAAYVGACIVRNHGGEWAVRRPLWESLVDLESRAGRASLAVFHWWLKALAGDATLADRYRTHVEIPCMRTDDLPIIAPPDRKLPRLEKVRYDVLYKYLKAHLPELKDLGADFPSAERFAEYSFSSLGFVLLGGGRMLLMHGQNADGVHLFWLGAAGFEKSAFHPADKFPEHRVKVEGDRLQIIVSVDGKMAVHEMLWWGP
jgi:hypothetical protein